MRLFDLQIWAAVPSRKNLPVRTRALGWLAQARRSNRRGALAACRAGSAQTMEAGPLAAVSAWVTEAVGQDPHGIIRRILASRARGPCPAPGPAATALRLDRARLPEAEDLERPGVAALHEPAQGVADDPATPSSSPCGAMA